MVRAVIVGTGDHAYAVAHLFKNSNNESSGNFLEVTKPGFQFDGTEEFHDSGIDLTDFTEAIARADIIILSIPASALERFVKKFSKEVRDKILVDATNSNHQGKDLFSILSYKKKDIRWVKGLNDFGAVDVLIKKPEGKKKVYTKMCSPDTNALQTVKAFAEESLGCEVKVVPIQHYSAIAQHQSSLGKEWTQATIVMVIVYLLCQLYNILRYVMIYTVADFRNNVIDSSSCFVL